MGDRLGKVDRFVIQRMLAHWTTAAEKANLSELSQLRTQRNTARQVRGAVDRLLHVAETRLALPRIGSNAFPKPPGTKWAWRPPLWRGPVSPRGRVGLGNGEAVGPAMKVFHDCKVSEMTFRQIRNTREEDLAAFGLQMDVLGFDGSFLSVVIDLPDDAADGLRKRDIVGMHALITTERPTTVFARLNIKCGPNTEQLVVELPMSQEDVTVDFDLAYADVVENRVDAMWLDMIFEEPAMNHLRLHDLTMYRYPRAEV